MKLNPKYTVSSEVAKKVREAYMDFYRNKTFPPLTYFLSHWESEKPKFATYLNTAYNIKKNREDEDRSKLLDSLSSAETVHSFLKSFAIAGPSEYPSFKLTIYTEILSLASVFGIEAGKWRDYYVLFSKAWEDDIINFQTFEETKETLDMFLSLFNKDEERRKELYPKEDVGSLDRERNEKHKEVIMAFRYLMASRKGLSFRSQLEGLSSKRESWKKIRQDIDAVAEQISDLELNNDYSDLLRKDKQKALKQILKTIKTKNLLGKTHKQFKEEYIDFYKSFLDRLSPAKIKKALKGTELKGLSKEQTRMVEELFYILILPRLYYVSAYLLFIGLTSSALEYLSALSRRGEIEIIKNLENEKGRNAHKIKIKKGAVKGKKGKIVGICPKCGEGIPKDASKCPDCGEDVEGKLVIGYCSACGADVSLDSKECSNCGVKFK